MWVTDGRCPHSAYAVTLLRSYDKVVAAGIAAIKEVDAASAGAAAAAGAATGHGRPRAGDKIQPFKKRATPREIG